MLQVLSQDRTPIAYHKTGTGPPLVLIHGTTADHRRWNPIIPRFAEHFTVCAMDRRGRGGSGDAPEYHIRREAEDVAAVVDAQGEPVFVLAHSHGAVCALEGALLTDNIRRMVLYEPPLPVGLPTYPPEIPDRMAALIEQGEPEAALEIFFREVVRMPEYEFEPYRRLPVWKERVRLAHTVPREITLDRSYRFQPEKFARLHVPVMLLLGEDSPEFMHRATAAAHDALPESRIVVLPGEQHIAMDTNPDLFVKEVLAFLNPR